MVVNSKGTIVGATLGNDVNLRDVEGRSALLLGKAKDNNASASLGPFIRLFDGKFTIETVKAADIALSVTGEDGFELDRRFQHEPDLALARSDRRRDGSAGIISIRMGWWSIWARCSRR